MRFEKIDARDSEAVLRLSRMATEIVREHYDPIIGKAQNDYMLEKFQSPAAILNQIRQGSSYYTVSVEGKTAGFLAFYPEGETLYLSKFYLYKSMRRKGYSKEMLSFVQRAAREKGLSAVELHVNRGNPSIAVYEALGFQRVCAEKRPIGSGYFMDDYRYRLPLSEGGR